MRVLFVSRWFPYPPINGSKQRVYHLIRALAEAHEVSLLSFTDDPSIEPDAAAIRGLCADIQTVPWQAYRPRSAPALLGLLGSTPRSIADTYSAEMAERVQQACRRDNPAVVVASQLSGASYHACFARRPAIFDEVELGVYDDQLRHRSNPLARGRYALTWMKLSRYLTRVLDDMDACTVASAEEAALLRRAVRHPPRTEIVPNGATLPDTVVPTAQRSASTLIFTGALTYGANADAMQWFLDGAYPLVKAQRPATTLLITGDAGGRSLSGDGVVQTGHVPDARALVAEATVSIAPLRWGGGTRLKLLEAMALGTPIVATTKAAEGIAVEDNVHLLIADDPPSFAGCVLRLLADVALRQRLTDNARRLVSQRYQWSGIGRQFVRLVEDVARTGHRVAR